MNVIAATITQANGPVFVSGTFSCRLAFASFAIASNGYILTLTFITLTRYLYTCHQGIIITLKWIYYTIGIIWLISIAITLPSLLGFWGNYRYYMGVGICMMSFRCQDQDGVSLSYKLTIGLLFYFLPWLVMLYCYLSIYSVYQKFFYPPAKKFFCCRLGIIRSFSDISESFNCKKEFRKTFYFFIACLLHLITFLPYAIWNFSHITNTVISSSLYHYYALLIITSTPTSIFNPIILIVTSKIVRKQLGCFKRTAVPVINVQSAILYDEVGREDSRLTLEYPGYCNSSLVVYSSQKIG
ncbi:G-protein coupled receptor moody [Trichoplax sp. H2]|nr:G-protein coupled receptor moody [Trichoplax sp. H2]|eukprot:RDD36365.1 G-protein coupled receptor moody [Trichoplax sp. H2]